MSVLSSSVLRIPERWLKRLLPYFFKYTLNRNRKGTLPPGAVFSRILVIRQHNQLGDMLCVVPLLRALRKAFPNAQISLLASRVNYDVMRGNIYLNDVILYDKSEFLSGGRFHLIVFWRFLRRLRGLRFEAVIVPATVSVSVTSDILAYSSGARYRVGARSLEGVENPTGFLYTVPVDLKWGSGSSRHQALRNFDVAASLGLQTPDLSSEITLLPHEVAAGKSFVDSIKGQKRLCIAFHPGAGKIPNRWPAERFSLVANILGFEFDGAIVITSGAFDGDPTSEMRSKLAVTYEVVAGRPIREVAAILAECNLLISNDTGIMHVGAAVGTPVLSLFGPTDPHQWAPAGKPHRYLVGQGGDIERITTDQVLQAGREMLREILMESKSAS